MHKSKNIEYTNSVFWRIAIKITQPISIESLKGSCMRKPGQEERIIKISFRGMEYDIVSITEKSIRISTLAANKIPIYARIINEVLLLSNMAHLLIEKNDILNISSSVLSQQLMGIDYPRKNIFVDIKLLDASSYYVVKGGEIIYDRSKLSEISDVKIDDIHNAVYDNYERILRNKDGIAVLLSGGFDSRLNLALVEHFARTYKYQTYTYHEYKNQEELQVTEQIAKIRGFPLIVKTRKDYLDNASRLMFDENFIMTNNGSYRNNLLRWHGYLDWIVDDCKNRVGSNVLVIGLGFEAHKGKYYNIIRSIKDDPIHVFGVRDYALSRVAKYLEIDQYNKDEQREYFEDLLLKAKMYSSKHSIIDFIHYHTYVSNGLGERGHNLIRSYGIPFPLLENDLLRKVFSVDYSQKINFKIVTDMLAKLGYSDRIQYVSANSKSTEVPSKYSIAVEHLKRKIFEYYSPNLQWNGQSSLTEMEYEIIASKSKFNSQITKRLHEIILEECRSTPGIRLEYAIELFNYLSTIENKYNATLICV